MKKRHRPAGEGYQYVRAGYLIYVRPRRIYAHCIACNVTLDWQLSNQGIAAKDRWMQEHKERRHTLSL